MPPQSWTRFKVLADSDEEVLASQLAELDLSSDGSPPSAVRPLVSNLTGASDRQHCRANHGGDALQLGANLEMERRADRPRTIRVMAPLKCFWGCDLTLTDSVLGGRLREGSWRSRSASTTSC